MSVNMSGMSVLCNYVLVFVSAVSVVDVMKLW